MTYKEAVNKTMEDLAGIIDANCNECDSLDSFICDTCIIRAMAIMTIECIKTIPD